MDSQWTQISVTKLGNSKIIAGYQYFMIIIKDSQWVHFTYYKGLKKF
jgi:hypothetical protein